MAQILMITSLKGGVGKTTLAAGLTYELARAGKKVLAVDMDLGTGGLDIALGREDMVGATIIDVLDGTVPIDRAMLHGDDGVYFMCAPVFFNESSLDKISQENFNSLLKVFKESFDYIVFDMPAGGGAAFKYFENSGLVDLTLIVTTSAPTAVRAAERCAIRISKLGNIRLVLNAYKLKSPDDNTFGIVEVIKRASLSIIGVIPYDVGAEKSLSHGIPLTGVKNSLAGAAMRNIARRIEGENVLLFDGLMKKKKRSRYY